MFSDFLIFSQFFWLKVSFLSDFTIFSVFPRCDCSHMGHWGTQQVRGHRRQKTEKKTWRKTRWKERQKILSEKQGRKSFPFKTSFQRSRQSRFPFRFSRFPRLLFSLPPRPRHTRGHPKGPFTVLSRHLRRRCVWSKLIGKYLVCKYFWGKYV